MPLLCPLGLPARRSTIAHTLALGPLEYAALPDISVFGTESGTPDGLGNAPTSYTGLAES